MLTVRPSAESGGQSLRSVGLQLDQVCADMGAMRMATEVNATSDRMEERILVGGDDREIVIEAGVSAENCGTVMSDGLGYLGTSEY
jgi:hypothetical protein